VLSELKKSVESGDLRLGDAIGQALHEVRGKVSDQRILWLVNEMNGYPNPLDWYKRPSNDFPTYRVVVGELKSVDKAGKLGDVSQALETKGQYFLAAPISWLEDAAATKDNAALIELQELSTHFAKASGGGGIVCVCSKDQVNRILASVRNSFFSLINEVVAKEVIKTPHY
jgi:hypothetical protein